MTDPKSSSDKASSAARAPARKHISLDSPFHAPKLRERAAAEGDAPDAEPTAAEPTAAEPTAAGTAAERAAGPAEAMTAPGAPAARSERGAERARPAPMTRAAVTRAAPSAPEDADLETVLRLPSIAEVAALLEAQPIKAGSLVRASVAAVSASGVKLSLEGGQSVTVSPREFASPPTVGDALHAYVDRVADDGALTVSPSKADKLARWDRLLTAVKENANVPGRVLAEQRGGVSVEIEGLKAFCPRRQLDLAPGQRPVDLIGQTLTFKLVAFDPRKADLSVSRRAPRPERRREAPPEGAEASEGAEGAEGIEGAEGAEAFDGAEGRRPRPAREAREPRAPREPVALPEEGAVLEGTVRSLTDYGAFVNVGETSGLLPVSELSWGRVGHPSDLLQVGQAVTVKVLRVETDKGRIRLSLKALQPDPWAGAEDRLPAGTPVDGKVIALSKFGAFVEVEPGLEGLVHTSELSWTRRVNSPGEVVAVGDTLRLVVLRIDGAARKLGLSLKAAAGNPYDRLLAEFPVGARLKGTIRSVTDFGVFVAIAEGIDGLVHRTDLSWSEPGPDPRSAYRAGEAIEVMVLDIDAERQRIALGVKQLAPDAAPAPVGPDPRFAALEVGGVVPGKVVRVVDFGAFVALESGLEGLLHRSEIGETPVEDATTVLAPGAEIAVRVVAVDAARRRISLSRKGLSGAPAPQAEPQAAPEPPQATAQPAPDSETPPEA